MVTHALPRRMRSLGVNDDIRQHPGQMNPWRMIEFRIMMYRSTVYSMLALMAMASACSKPGGDAPQKEARTHTIARGELTMAVSATGEVEASYKVEVKSKASGEILEFPFEPGDKVKKGDILIRLDQKTEKRNAALMEADLGRAKAELDSAKADLLEKQISLKRAKSLAAKDLVASQELDLAVSRAAMAAARISQMEAFLLKAELALEDARERLAETVIQSPIDGVIVEKSVEKGQIIASGITSVTGGTRLLVVADLERLFVYALVDETDIGHVSVGQKAEVTVDAYPNKAFEGVVERIYPTGETKDNITVFRVKVEIMDLDKALLRPGMTANVDIVLERKPDVLIVPDEAITYSSSSPKEGTVSVKSGGKQVERQITMGLSNGFETEAVSGLKEGDVVVIKPAAP